MSLFVCCNTKADTRCAAKACTRSARELLGLVFVPIVDTRCEVARPNSDNLEIECVAQTAGFGHKKREGKQMVFEQNCFIQYAGILSDSMNLQTCVCNHTHNFDFSARRPS